MALPQVDQKLLEELEEMGFSLARAIEALHYLGNADSDAIMNWLIDHENASNINQMPRVSVELDIGSPEPGFMTEEIKIKAQELRDRASKSRNKEKYLPHNKEKDRIRASKELLEAKKIAEENERKRYLAAQKAEKEEEKKARERVLQKLENDKRERRRQLGSRLEVPPVINPSLPPSEKKRSPIGYSSGKVDQTRGCLRSLKLNNNGDDVGVRRAFQTLLTIIGNVMKNPDEEKFRRIRLTNPVFQDRVGYFEEGVEFLLLCGFEITEDGKFLHLPGDRVNTALLNLAVSQLQSALSNPFFGLLEH